MNNDKTGMWLLVRSNPNKKDSIHYNLGEALRLQKQLAHGTLESPYGERTEIHELLVDRQACSISMVSNSFVSEAIPRGTE